MLVVVEELRGALLERQLEKQGWQQLGQAMVKGAIASGTHEE